jgi:hypothetical protein
MVAIAPGQFFSARRSKKPTIAVVRLPPTGNGKFYMLKIVT